jgi:hypothetical protein
MYAGGYRIAEVRSLLEKPQFNLGEKPYFIGRQKGEEKRKEHIEPP